MHEHIQISRLEAMMAKKSTIGSSGQKTARLTDALELLAQLHQ